MIIQHNIPSMTTNRQLGIINTNFANSTEKLASGYRINRASDDAAGLAISEKMRSQIRGLNKASENAETGVSLIQTAEGALGEVQDMLHRMNELAVQAANDTNTSSDRKAIKAEIDQLASDIDRISSTTQFNSMNLLDGSFTSKNLQVGSLCGQSIQVDIYAMDTHGLGLTWPYNNQSDLDSLDYVLANRGFTVTNIEKDDETNIAYDGCKVFIAGTTNKNNYNGETMLYVDSFENCGRTMKLLQNANELISEMRSFLGAAQNRLEHTIANLDNTAENTQAAESRLRDANIAKEMVEYSKNNILSQAGQAMLAQANQQKQGVLSLLS